MKKHIKIIAIIFFAVLIFEMLMVTYNEVIYKVYEKKHLIGNEPYKIELENVTLKKEQTNITIEVNQAVENIYNLSLNLKNENRRCLY